MEYTRCQLCNSDNYSLLSRGEFSIVKCNNCSFIYTNPRPTAAEIGKYYPQSYFGEDNLRFNRLIESALALLRKNRARCVASLIAPGRILDIGCGRGKMLSFLKKKNWQAVGTEISIDSSRYARERLNLEVIPRNVCELNFPAGYFDVITLFNSLEHLPNPRQALIECGRILKAGGLLIIELPNIDSIQARLFKNRWFHLDLPRHYSHFSQFTLEEMLGVAGFEAYKFGHFSLEFAPFGVLQSLLNQLRLPFNMLYDIFKSETARTIKNRGLGYCLQVLITMLLLPSLAVMSIIISLTEAILKKGGMIKAYARKISN